MRNAFKLVTFFNDVSFYLTLKKEVNACQTDSGPKQNEKEAEFKGFWRKNRVDTSKFLTKKAPCILFGGS
jgi:hypothetical protein